MKPFSLKEAKAGKPVCNRAWENVRILCFDRKGEDYPIVALHDNQNGEELICLHTSNGRDLMNTDSELDLFMKSEKRTGWVNVFINTCSGVECAYKIYPNKDEAMKDINTKSKYYIDTVEIEWEE